MRLLVVEDDAPLPLPPCQVLGRWLRQWGDAVELAADGPTALALCEREAFDLVILDLGLPGCDGLEVCRRLRQGRGPQALILMLSAWDSSADKVTGLEEGTDDVGKPFDPDVVRARVRALVATTLPESASGEVLAHIDAVEVRMGRLLDDPRSLKAAAVGERQLRLELEAPGADGGAGGGAAGAAGAVDHQPAGQGAALQPGRRGGAVGGGSAGLEGEGGGR